MRITLDLPPDLEGLLADAALAGRRSLEAQAMLILCHWGAAKPKPQALTVCMSCRTVSSDCWGDLCPRCGLEKVARRK